MKILEVFEQKLRYKNYSDKTIKTYLSYLKQFIQTQNIKDPYQVTTKQICEFLHTNKFTHTYQIRFYNNYNYQYNNQTSRHDQTTTIKMRFFQK